MSREAKSSFLLGIYLLSLIYFFLGPDPTLSSVQWRTEGRLGCKSLTWVDGVSGAAVSVLSAHCAQITLFWLKPTLEPLASFPWKHPNILTSWCTPCPAWISRAYIAFSGS